MGAVKRTGAPSRTEPDTRQNPLMFPMHAGDEAASIASRLKSDSALRAAVETALASPLLDSRSVATAGSASSNHRELAGFHSMFFLTCHPSRQDGGCAYWDWQFFGLWLVVLVILTIVVEHAMHALEQCTKFSSRLGHHIYQKMIRELALLGFVSWFAIVLSNAPFIGEWLKVGSAYRFLMLEFAHILVFVMAIMFCLMIGLVYLTVKRIEKEWSSIEDPEQQLFQSDWDPWKAPMDVLKRLDQLLTLRPVLSFGEVSFSFLARRQPSQDLARHPGAEPSRVRAPAR